MYRFWVFVHLLGVFGFLMAHGISAGVGLRLRRERNLERVAALLDLSSSSLSVMYLSVLLLLGGGVVAGFLGDWWGRGWIWASIGVLVAMFVAMYALASTYYDRVRMAAGIQTYQQRKKGIEASPPAPQDLEALLASSRPWVIAAVGVAGLVTILYLMVLKPF